MTVQKFAYRADIDGLRGIAVLAVLLSHAKFELFAGGFVGVDVFFVISGFLITSFILPDVQARKFSLVGFYERRIRRLFPALFAVVLISAVPAAFILTPPEFKDFGQSVLAAASFSSNILFWWESGYFGAAGAAKPLLHTWTLAVEEQFYVTYPLFLMLIARFSGGRFVPITVIVLVVSIGLSVWMIGFDRMMAFYFAPSRAFELMIGALIAMGAFPECRHGRLGTGFGVLGLGMIAWSVGSYDSTTAFPGLKALVPTIGTGLVIYSALAGPTAVSRALSWRPLVFTGLISYSLYLWHWPLLVFAQLYVPVPLGVAATLGLLLLSGLVATLSWRFVEKPFRGAKGRLKRRQLFAAAGAVSAVSVILGLGIHLARGVPQRYAPIVDRAAAVAIDPFPNHERCHSKSVDEVRAGKLCRIGFDQAQEPSFLLLGDSHAEALAPAINDSAKRHGATGLIATASGCTPLLGVTLEDGTELCQPFLEAVIHLLNANPRLETVVLIGRWAVRAEGTTNNLPPFFFRDANTRQTGRAENRRVFRRSLIRLLERLEGRKVYIVASVPEMLGDVPAEIARGHMLGRPPVLEPSLASFFERQNAVFSILGEVEDTHSVEVLFPHRLLCNDAVCPASKDGMPLYFDGDHLTAESAISISELFDPIFERRHEPRPGTAQPDPFKDPG